jgi:hypothetical protein
MGTWFMYAYINRQHQRKGAPGDRGFAFLGAVKTRGRADLALATEQFDLRGGMPCAAPRQSEKAPSQGPFRFSGIEGLMPLTAETSHFAG